MHPRLKGIPNIIDTDQDRSPVYYVFLAGATVVGHGDDLDDAVDAALRGIKSSGDEEKQVQETFPFAATSVAA
jgi:ABC-type amino acid transport substrate-binding protein